MIIHTVMVSYQRLDLTQQAVQSYLDTVTAPHTLIVVDNGSSQDVTDWILNNWGAGFSYRLLGANHYPGFACNRGFEDAPDEATVLHRADNDFVFLDGWCEEIQRCFAANPNLGQLGMRTGDEELHNSHNVGGNCAFRRLLWDQGLRWDETPWPLIETPGWTEDSYMSPSVEARGWQWGRVQNSCIRPISHESIDDEYYRKSWSERGII